ncbi:unnamed protein product [Diabrotica balteata]|uniref:IPT/TIG domain-containing protein n=1 Tax=Diabrotica balteata TaxID=107213 RepID=A0A9N9SZ08_DIABA|nr:unnamed protein product [Diabrotica balteata]
MNPDIVLVHYLNVPYPDDNKLAVITPSLALWADKKEWTKEELVSQLKPMFFSEDEPDINNELEISTAETVEAIVSQLMEKQRVARQAALVKQLECGCPDSTCADGKSCSHPMRRITAAKEVANSPLPSASSNSRTPSNSDNNNQVSSTTGTGSLLLGNGNSPRVYSRDTRNQHVKAVQNNTNCSSSSGNTPPLVLSLSQIQGGGGLLILNSNSGNNSNNHQNLVNPVPVAHSDTIPVPASYTVLKDVSDDCDCEINANENIECEKSYESDEDRSSKLFTQEKLNGLARDLSLAEGAAEVFGSRLKSKNLLASEDIQRTLSANMPLCSTELNNQNRTTETNTNNHQNKSQPQQQQLTNEINPMDFIDSCDVVVSPTHVVDDDVFVNLDAFDMLGEFPDLESLDSGNAGLLDVNPSENRSNTKAQPEHQQSNHPLEGSAKITDYSPEWAYPEGGVKVLVTGPWHSSGPYTVLFDTFPVPTTLVQSGVLRCYCPAHEAGLATLQVACDGYVISNSVIFEYKLPPREEQVAAPEPKVERCNDNLLKFTLLQRLEAMDDRLQIKQEPVDNDVMWACARGHTETAVMLYKWNHNALYMKNVSNQTALDCARSNNHMDLVKEIEKLELRRDKANMMLHSNLSSIDTLSPTLISPASSIGSLISIASTSKSHDGVFLRPGAVTRSEVNRYKILNVDLDSDTNNKLITSAPSPMLSDFSSSTRGSNGQKLVKRPSIDSGINMSCGPAADSYRPKSSKVFNSRDTPKLSKFDRSMSLPLQTSCLKDHSFDNDSLDSHKKMDFALWINDNNLVCS